jgi:hypothetical protein
MAGLLRETLDRGLAAFVANRLALLAVLVLGGVLLGSYYQLPTVRAALDAFAVWKNGLGLWYPVLAFPLIGGLLPLGLIWWMRGEVPTRRSILVVLLFWPERGLEIHFLYAGLTVWFGTGTDTMTVLAKTAVDMFLYSALWALPVYLLALAAGRGEAPWALVRSVSFWRERYLPGLLANWMLWIPAVLMIYSLPVGLQLPVQNLFMVIWVLVASLIATKR